MSKLNQVRQMNKVTMELGGKVRTLIYDLNAFAELENRYGSIEAAFAKMDEGSIGAVRTVLWAGIIHDEAVIDEVTGEPIKYNVTPFQVGSWITMDMIEEIGKNIGRAVEGVIPDKEEVQATPTPELKVVDPTVAQTEEDEKN